MLHRKTPRILLTGLALTSVAGCGRDADSAKVSEASAVMDVQHVTDAEKSYQHIKQLLDSVSSSASAGTTEAAATLMGAAKNGMANGKAQACQALEFTAREMGIVVRSATSKWQRLDVQSKAAAQITVSAELDEITKMIADRRADREANLQAKAGFDEQVAQLDTQINELRAKAAEQRDQAGELQLKLSQVSAQEAATLAERIREFTLRADEFDRNASELSTTRDQITPEAHEAALNVEKIETQLQLLDRQRAEAQAREQRAQEDAASARAAADAAASEVRNLANELTTYVDDQLMPAFATVISGINESQASSRKGGTVTRESSQLATAAALQAKGIVESRRSAALEEVARVFENIAASGVLSNASQTAEEYHTRATEAYEAACEAFTSGASALRSVRLTGNEFRNVGQRLKDAADTLDKLATTPFGEIPDLTAPAVDEEDDAYFDDATDTEEAPADDAEEPLDEI